MVCDIGGNSDIEVAVFWKIFRVRVGPFFFLITQKRYEVGPMFFYLSIEKVSLCMFEKFRNMELSWMIILRGQENEIGFPKISLERISCLASFEIFLKRHTEK